MTPSGDHTTPAEDQILITKRPRKTFNYAALDDVGLDDPSHIIRLDSAQKIENSNQLYHWIDEGAVKYYLLLNSKSS